jgi:hypothetical protein
LGIQKEILTKLLFIQKMIKNSKLNFFPTIWYIANKMRIIFIFYKINFYFGRHLEMRQRFYCKVNWKFEKKKKKKKTECRFLGFLKSQTEDCCSLKQKNKTKKTNKNTKSRLNEILQTLDDADCSWAQKTDSQRRKVF